MAETKTMVLFFGFSFPFSAVFHGRGGLSFWLQFLPKRSVGEFCFPLKHMNLPPPPQIVENCSNSVEILEL